MALSLWFLNIQLEGPADSALSTKMVFQEPQPRTKRGVSIYDTYCYQHYHQHYYYLQAG